MTDSRKDWDEKADFLKAHNAIHGEWVTRAEYDGEREVLIKLTLAPPLRPFPSGLAAAEPKEPKTPKGVAASMLERHNTMFAHTRFKPPMPKQIESDVPRAVAAKQAASERGKKKVSKRGS